MGGIALGNGVTTSGLLKVLGDGIRGLISDMALYPLILLLSVIVLVRTSEFYFKPVHPI